MVKMHRGSSKVWFFMICAMVLLATVSTIRPLERDHRKKFMASSESFTKELPIAEALSNSEEEAQRIDVEEECEKNLDEEECLNRRSLAAHTDYIYTQNHDGP